MGSWMGKHDTPPRGNYPDCLQPIAKDMWQELVISTYRTCKIRRQFMKQADYIVEIPVEQFDIQTEEVEVDDYGKQRMVTIKMVQEEVICRIKDNSGKQVLVKIIMDLPSIFPECSHIYDDDGKERPDVVRCQTQFC